MTTRIIAALSLLAAVSAGSAWAANPQAGEKIAGAVCAGCHLADGNSTNPDYPRLAGQQPDYLAKALRDYQSGARNNAVMKAFATALKAEDIEDVASWYATRPRVLGIKR